MPSSRRTPRRRKPPRADMESAPTTNGGRAANRETANLAIHQTPVGDDACIVPGTLRRANARGRNKSRPYGQILCFGPTGMAPPTRAAVGRDALIPPHPAPPRTPAGGYGIRPYNQRRARGQPGNRCPCVIINPCRGRCSHRPGGLYAARTTAGGYGIRPYNQRRARGQPGNRKPCDTSNPCRGRCSHRPGNLTPRERPRAG